MSNNNRHKRQRSSANPQQFHLENNHPYLSQDDRPPPPPLQSRPALQLLHDSARYPSINASMPASSHNLHGSYSVPANLQASSSSFLDHLVPSTTHLAPQLSVIPHHPPPITDFNAIPLVFSYTGNFEEPLDLSTLGDHFLAQHDYTSHQPPRPQTSSWVSAPDVFSHNKNISISSHFDMFTLNEHHYESPTARQVPSLSQLQISHLILEPNRLPYLLLLRMANAPTDHQPQLQHALILHDAPRAPNLYDHERSSQINSDDSSTQTRLLRNIVKIDAFNLNSYLLSILNELGTPPSLDDFYNILYNNETFTSYIQQNEMLPKIDKSNLLPTSESMDLLHLILDVFRDPQSLIEYFPSLDMSGNKLASVNFHELLRSFLALKILFDSLVEVKESSNSLDLPTLPRLSIYKVYYILCQKLILKYPTKSNSTSLQQKLILGQSKLGKLIKLVYPNLLSKRLGRRGESKYNYLGVKWNPNIVDDEITELCEEDITKLAEIFKNEKKMMDIRRKRTLPSRHLALSHRRPSIHRRQSIISTNLSLMPLNEGRIRPLITFVHSNTKFPLQGFSPLSLVSNPENVDPRTSWLGAARHHSLMALQDYNIDLLTIRNVLLNEANLASDENWLFNELSARTEMIISSAFREDKDYLHLFLAVAIDILPSILVHDSVKNPNMKNNLRLLAKKFGLRFSQTTPIIDSSDINAFVGIIKRMVHLTELLGSLCLSILDSTLLEDMRGDLDRLAMTSQDYYIEEETPLSRLRVIITQGILRTLNSYQFLQDEDGNHLSTERVIELVQRDARSLLNSILESLSRFIQNTSTKIHDTSVSSALELSTTVSTHLVDLLHSELVTDSLTKRYPIVVVKDMVTYISNQVLTSVYNENLNLNQGGTGSLNPTFRHWWILATYFQEYLGLLSELVGLYETLS